MDRYDALKWKKESLESDILALQASLGEVGMSDSLIDSEGFPIPGIDHLHIRTTRRRLIELTNDHKTIMLAIEESLKTIFQLDDFESLEMDADEKIPIAIINAVSPDSPAFEAGLLKDDLVFSIAHLNHYSLKSMSEIADFIKERENRAIRIVLKRQDLQIELMLVPKKWSGPGLLGCHILPFQK